MMQMDKRTSHVTENNKNVTSPNQKSSSNKHQDMHVKELSDTTANPSNLGNVSNIRDPRYSQEMMML